MNESEIGNMANFARGGSVTKGATPSNMMTNTYLTQILNKTKVIRADLLDFTFDLDLYFEDIFRIGNISVLVTFQF